ncbi:ABC transporter substrate-binding protein [Bradyrhizobium sp. 197]|uniref:ABC transporter substrate-binding protein n=1 Tax=Bradyrhizobium sp. 197 TaxID=2782663 RepID=UPI001FF79DA2|nr:ABC transporter substrate-binding protein [Bradyrhizobium sp. 197]MCK1479937.1 ABC transporter substrate-binding protein [Bradyrhizobium sp. 197]
MENDNNRRNLTTEPREPTRPCFSRRTVLGLAGAFGVAAPLATVTVARALTALKSAPLPDELPFCRTAMPREGLSGPPRALTLAWNATSVCTAAAPVAKERGVFAKHNLDVDFINFGGSTEQLLEAIATGKADAGIGMALRWLKPLEQGFDVRITAGVHGGCIRLLGSKTANITSLESLRGKTIAISDQASPAKNFFSIAFAKKGIDPVRDVDWRQYPADLLALAVEKGEAHALTDNDPRTYLWLKSGKLNEVMTNLSGGFADRICCVLAIRGSLIRGEPAAAGALTRSVLEAGDMVARNPADAAAAYSAYGGKGSLDDLGAILASHTHHNHPIGAELKRQIVLYADELKEVNVLKRSTDPTKFAERVYVDVLS